MKFTPFRLLLILTLYWFINLAVLAEENLSLNIPAARSALDISHDYHKTLLLMALKAADAQREVELKERPFRTESRVIAEIKKHQLIDVYWLGGDIDLEKQLKAIPVPTTKGLIGFRKFIIRQESVSAFNSVDSLKQLQKLTACQGESWPDTRILRHAKFSVTTAEKYEDLFRMLAAKRCDYFPRGIHDHTKEVELRQLTYPDFVSYQNILLHYPFGVFFYVSKDNTELANSLEKGMRLLAQSGEIEALMQDHPLTRHIFPLNSTANLKLFELSNPYLGSDIDTNDKALWLQPEDFQLNETSDQSSK